jgi:3-dehydroquinate synthase
MPHTFDITSGTPPGWATRVVVGRGVLANAAATIARTYRSHRLVVVSDARVAKLYGSALCERLETHRAPAALVTFPPGERSKTRETKARLEDKILALGAGRDTLVIALGGGVTGDLAGFLAATWHRGVPVVQVPTTTLAMCDAALGGKTGVDVSHGKNFVGAFHQPVAVYADVETLATLSPRVYAAGLSEAVKTAVALDEDLFRMIERSALRLVVRDLRTLSAVIARVLRLKGEVVAADPRDNGRRAVLNFGHTVAHALESASSFRIPHGEAVAIGIAAEARVAQRLTGFPAAQATRIVSLLEALGLPVRAPRNLDPRRLSHAFRLDKKTRGGIVHCALPERFGRMAGGATSTVAVDPARDLLPFLRQN